MIIQDPYFYNRTTQKKHNSLSTHTRETSKTPQNSYISQCQRYLQINPISTIIRPPLLHPTQSTPSKLGSPVANPHIPATRTPIFPRKEASRNYLMTVASVLGTTPTLGQFNMHKHTSPLQLVTGAGLDVVVLDAGALVIVG